MQLYSYYRSSASYRVRIALNLKGLEAELVPVNLLQSAQQEPAYLKLNPQGLLPALVAESGTALGQSLAIIEYLEETHPQPALLPEKPEERARVRAIAHAIACEMAPLNNLRVLKYLTGEMGLDDTQKMQWYRHWIALGFSAVETMLQDGHSGKFCHGDTPTLADCCLVPQVYNARRFACDLGDYPTVCAIADACDALPAFREAHPDNQTDAG